MSELIAALIVPTTSPGPDVHAGHQALQALTEADLATTSYAPFASTVVSSLARIPDAATRRAATAEAERAEASNIMTPALIRRVGHPILRDLQRILHTTDLDLLVVGQYRILGVVLPASSHRFSPIEAAKTIREVQALPPHVLAAMGVLS